MNATDWRWRDRLAERLALLDVRRHVVEHRLRRTRPRARTRRGATAARTRRSRPSASPSDARSPGPRRPSSVSVVSDGGAHAHGRVGLDRQAGGAGLDEEQHAASPSSSAPTTKSSASAPRGDHRLHAVEDVAVAVAGGGGRGASASNSGRGSVSASAAAGTLVAGEGREVGRLLLVGAPQRRARWRPRRGRASATASPRSPLRERLGHQRAGHRRALLGDAAERLGHAEDRQPDLEARLEHACGRARRRRRPRRRPGGPPRRRTR